MRLCWALALAPLLAGLFVARVAAQREARAAAVALETEACAGLAQPELNELIALELAPRKVLDQAQAEPTQASAHARLTCDAREARIALRMEAGRAYEVQLDLAPIQPSARARLIALALSELLATAEMDAQPATPSTPSPSTPSAPSEAPPSASTPEARRQLWLSVGLAREGAPRLLTPLGELGFGWQPGGLPLLLAAKLYGGAGERALEVGRVAAWDLGAALALAYAKALGRVRLSIGVGATLGYAQLRGRGAAALVGRSVGGLFWGPVAALDGVLTLRGRWGLRAGLDLAYLVRRIEGSDAAGGTLFRFGPVQLHATLGVAAQI